MEPLFFTLSAFRLHFLARGSVHFPPGKSGNIIRGALGTIFRRQVCAPDCTDPRTCSRRAICPYARLFAPRALEKGPSGLADPPRPFVFRAAHLDGYTARPGEPFYFDMHLFSADDSALAHFAASFAQLAQEGIGPGRGRAELTSVDELAAQGEPRQICERPALLPKRRPCPIEIDLGGGSHEPAEWSRITIRFLTPTELKHGNEPISRPEFAVLFLRAVERISNLRALYGAGPLPIDFREMKERAENVKAARYDVRHVYYERRSSRTGERHPLGGIVGEADYTGVPADFLPFLAAAKWTGIGRQTVWGKGAIEVLGAERAAGI